MIELEPVDGFTFTATIQPDDCQREPWLEEDGHGPVSDWRRQRYNGHCPKEPGELLLCKDHRSARFYDYREACKIALRDGWNAKPYDVAGETPRQRAAKAAMADYNRLRQWCDGQWCYVGVIVTAWRNGVDLASASLWGIESDCSDYLEEVAQELAQEALDQARATLASLCDCGESSK